MFSIYVPFLHLAIVIAGFEILIKAKIMKRIFGKVSFPFIPNYSSPVNKLGASNLWEVFLEDAPLLSLWEFCNLLPSAKADHQAGA